jgi:hypothetical protein
MIHMTNAETDDKAATAAEAAAGEGFPEERCQPEDSPSNALIDVNWALFFTIDNLVPRRLFAWSCQNASLDIEQLS